MAPMANLLRLRMSNQCKQCPFAFEEPIIYIFEFISFCFFFSQEISFGLVQSLLRASCGPLTPLREAQGYNNNLTSGTFLYFLNPETF